MSKISQVVRTEFAAAIAQIASERKISVDSIYEAIEHALVSAYRKQVGALEEDYYYFVELDRENGQSKIFKAPVLERDEETEEITKWDEDKAEDVTPAGFGRIAAQTAKQVILQKIRQTEKSQILEDYKDRVGELITGQVLRMRGRNVVVDVGRGQAIMPPQEQMQGEFYRSNQRIAVIIKSIEDTGRDQRIIVSRADKELVRKLFEREVPEVSSGSVEIVKLAREAGVRTKMAVRSTQEGVDPVGSCVGQRGIRVQKVIEELNNEKVDIIPFSEDISLFMQGALAPAENLLIQEGDEEDLIVVTAPDDQLSLAIGRGGQNVRLAAKLTGYQITIKSASGEIETKATGEEEFEIDTFEGLEDETREILVEYKLTTLNALSRFKDKWVENKDIPTEQKELLHELVAGFEKQQAEEQREFEQSK